jgi:methionine-rich copper-binding protein CopC
MFFIPRTIRRIYCGRPAHRCPCPLVLETLEERAVPDGASWSGYAHDAQHTGLSDVASQSLSVIRWQLDVDLNPQLNGGELLTHYGSPLITQANTVIVPVKTGATNGFRVEGHSGVDGSLMWTASTDYVLPPHGWIPSYSPTLTQNSRLYFAGAGGTVYYLDNPDQGGATTTSQIAFYGIGNYDHSLDSRVYINTPITADGAGDIYFGFLVTGSNSLNLQSGIARIGADGSGTWVAAHTAAGDSGINEAAYNSAPALSNDGSTVYIAVSNGNGGRSGSGYLLALNSTTLATRAKVALQDPLSGRSAEIEDDGTASPTVGPDGDVYYGVLENPFPENHDRGWLLHFSGDLSHVKTPGAFGWDDTATIVPSSMVPSYQGPSSYLLMTKYNNYAGVNGDGHNKIAIIDPNTPMTDPITGVTVMNEVLTHLGVTPDPEFPDKPGAVREWCINSAAVDPYTDSILANSEDGSLYRWDLSTNTFTESMPLHVMIGEAYTPTVIGTNGTVYAINGATLYALQSPAGPVVLSSTPSSIGSAASVRLTFSEAIDPTTFTPAKVTSFFGPAGPVHVTGVTPVNGSNNTQFDITFPSQKALGNYTFVLSPTIQDQSGNEIDTNDDGTPGEYPADQYIGHFTIVGPKIIASTPATNVYAPASSLRVTFNEPMDPATFTPAKVFSFSGPNGPIAVTGVVPVSGSNNTQFDIRFAAQTVTGVYQLLIGPNIRDLAGHQMDQNGNFVEGEIPGDLYYAHFGIRGPRIIASTPANNVFAPISTVRVTFDESMDPTSFTTDQVQFKGPQGNVISVTNIQPVAGSNNTRFDISFNGQTDLGSYHMVIGPNIRDTFGNAMDQNGNLITGEIPGDQYTATFTIVSTTIGPDGFGYSGTVHAFRNLELLDRHNTFTIIDSGHNQSVPVDLGSNTFSFYGVTYTGNNQLFVSSNGLITFGAANNSPNNSDLTMSPMQPAIAVLWADWIKSSSDGTGPMVLGRFTHFDANGVPHRLVIEWNQVHHNGGRVGTLTFQVILALNTGTRTSAFTFNYPNLASGDSWAEGNNATVGIKDGGTQGSHRLLVNEFGRSPFVGTDQAVRFSAPGAAPARGDLAGLVSATLVPAVVSPSNPVLRWNGFLPVTDATVTTLPALKPPIEETVRQPANRSVDRFFALTNEQEGEALVWGIVDFLNTQAL